MTSGGATQAGSAVTDQCHVVSASEIPRGPGTLRRVGHYLFNFVKGDAATGPALRERAAEFLRVGMWGIDADETHRNALAPGDLTLIYVGAPVREFIGRAELATTVHDWTASEAQVYQGDSSSGVLLAQVEEWGPPVPNENRAVAHRSCTGCQGRLPSGRGSDHRDRV